MADRDALFDKAGPPDERWLAEDLGKTFKLWVAIRDHLRAEYGPVTEEWKFYGAKYGWTLKTLRGKRNLFFFTPCQAHFRLAFAFSDKAVAAIERSGLPKAMIEELLHAKKYAEGRGLRVEVRTARDVEHVKTLIAVKVEN